MRLLSVVAFLIISFSALAGINIRPGLWSVKMKMSSNGQSFDPAAKMKAAMAEMPPEQRKKMMEMMSSKLSHNGEAMQVCYTEEMLKEAHTLGGKRDSRCKSEIISQTPSKVVTSFKCEDGARGTGMWSITSDQKYSGSVDITTKQGKNAKMDYEGEFVSADCGKLRPKKS